MSFLNYSIIVLTGSPFLWGQGIRYPKPNSHQDCKLQNGQFSCVEITTCKDIIRELSVGKNPVICGWKSYVPLVCCQDDNRPHESEKLEDKNVKLSRISSPGCGKRNNPLDASPWIDAGVPGSSDNIDYPEFRDEDLATTGVIGPRNEDPSESENGTLPPFQTGPHFAVGGVSASMKWPWMAAIFSHRGQKQLCGGVVIDRKHILTAAHCFAGKSRNPNFYKVIVGEINLNPEDQGKYDVEMLKIHEGYDPKYYYDDIAILRLSEELIDVTDVCLPVVDDLHPGDNCTVLGWGDLSYGGPSSSVLQEVDGLPVVPTRECDALYRRVSRRSFPRGIGDNFLCAGLDEGGKDACQGDSGGPLLHQDPGGKWITVGIVSFGYGCAEPGYPGVYTRVASYSDWIENHVRGPRAEPPQNRRRNSRMRARPRWRPIERVTFPRH